MYSKVWPDGGLSAYERRDLDALEKEKNPIKISMDSYESPTKTIVLRIHVEELQLYSLALFSCCYKSRI